MSLIIQEKVVKHREEQICIAVLGIKFNYSLFCLALAPQKSMYILIRQIFGLFLGGGMFKNRAVTFCTFLHTRSHRLLLDPVLNLCQHFLYKSLFWYGL